MSDDDIDEAYNLLQYTRIKEIIILLKEKSNICYKINNIISSWLHYWGNRTKDRRFNITIRYIAAFLLGIGVDNILDDGFLIYRVNHHLQLDAKTLDATTFGDFLKEKVEIIDSDNGIKTIAFSESDWSSFLDTTILMSEFKTTYPPEIFAQILLDSGKKMQIIEKLLILLYVRVDYPISEITTSNTRLTRKIEKIVSKYNIRCHDIYFTDTDRENVTMFRERLMKE